MIDEKIVFNEIIDQLIPLIESKQYQETKWEDLKLKFQTTYNNSKLQSHITAIQSLKQKADLLKFATNTFEILHQINLEVASLAPIKDILDLSARRLKEISKAHLVFIGMHDNEKNVLQIDSVAGKVSTGILDLEEPLNSSFQKKIQKSSDPFVIEDVSKNIPSDSTLLHLLSKSGVVSLIGSPLVVRNEIIGVIFLARFVPYTPNQLQLQMLKSYCSQTALAISNAQLYSNEIRVGELHEELFEEALNKGGYEGILQRVSNFIEEPILLLDEFGNAILAANPKQYKNNDRNINHIELYNAIQKSQQKKENSFEINNKGNCYSVFNICLHNRIVAYLILSKNLASYDQLSIVAIEQTKNVLALQINQEKTGIEVENRLRQDYLHDLIAGLATEEDLLRRARHLNISFDQPHAIIVLDPCKQETDFSIHLNHILDKFRYMIDKELLPLSMVQDQKLFLVTPGEHVNTITNFARNYTDEKYPDLPFRIGISNSIIQPKDYITAYNEAKKAADFASSFQFNSNIVHFNDLGIIGLLFNTENPTAMMQFMEKHLSKLIEYDKQNNSELLTTLEVFLDNESAIQASAEKLHIHYNTLRYRLNRLEDILDTDLANTQNRMNLQVAILIYRLKTQY